MRRKVIPSPNFFFINNEVIRAWNYMGGLWSSGSGSGSDSGGSKGEEREMAIAKAKELVSSNPVMVFRYALLLPSRNPPFLHFAACRRTFSPLSLSFSCDRSIVLFVQSVAMLEKFLLSSGSDGFLMSWLPRFGNLEFSASCLFLCLGFRKFGVISPPFSVALTPKKKKKSDLIDILDSCAGILNNCRIRVSYTRNLGVPWVLAASGYI